MRTLWHRLTASEEWAPVRAILVLAIMLVVLGLVLAYVPLGPPMDVPKP
jgi:hypothetical protein